MEPSVEIEVRGQSSPDYHLDITLTNRSARALTVYEHSLPWVGLYSMLLVAVKTDAVGSMIEKVQPVDDPGPTTVTLQPGETSAGNIHLASRFSGLLDALKDSDVIIFWSYRLQPIDMAPLQRVAGHVFFPKLRTKGEVEIK